MLSLSHESFNSPSPTLLSHHSGKPASRNNRACSFVGSISAAMCRAT
jgi:hypothetical protein